MSLDTVDIAILGAGPTGLGAAVEILRQSDCNAHAFERFPFAGGLARTVRTPSGFAWELGGHVTFSHFSEFDHLFDRYVAGRFSRIMRESWIRCENVWVPYPFQNNLHYLGDRATSVVDELVAAQNRAVKRFGSLKAAVSHAESLEDVIQRVFGEGVGELFMRPYNRKVWATDPSDLAASWLGERVALVDAGRVRENVRLQRDEVGWGPNNTFRFPAGGTGSLYEAMARDVDSSLHFEWRLTELDASARRMTFDTPAGSRDVRFDALISTAPIDALVMAAVDAPPNVKHAATQLRYASGDFVGVGLLGETPSTTSWMYFPGPETPFYRATYLSNYSPEFAPPGHHSLLCEASSPPGHRRDPSELIRETIDGLERTGLIQAEGSPSRDDIVETWHARVERSYPVPTRGRDDALAVILPWLESHQIFSRGRFGLWKYEVANTDHSVMQGIEVARRILHGTPETVMGIRYDDGLVHVRPETAGSGEKRLTTASARAQPPITARPPSSS